MALLVFLVWQLWIRLQFSNCNILGNAPLILQLQSSTHNTPPPLPLESPGSPQNAPKPAGNQAYKDPDLVWILWKQHSVDVQ